MASHAARAFWQQQEAAKGPMSDDLAQLLDLVWSHRTEPNPTYKLYTRGGQAVAFNLGQTRRFLGELAALGRVPEIQTESDDNLEKILRTFYQAFSAPAGGFLTLIREQWKRLIQDARWSDALATELSQTFYHFRGAGPAQQRIYLHVTMTGRVDVIRFLLQHVSPLRGFSDAKVAPPGPTERFDTIVIYLADQPAVDAALTQIAKYQESHRALFEQGTPRMLRPFPKYKGISLAGVAAGAEPRFDLEERHGHLRAVARPSSFGTFRSVIIDYCLHQALQGGGDKQQFVNLVQAQFRHEGIDPKAPFRG